MIRLAHVEDDAGIRALIRMAVEFADDVEYVGEAEDGEGGLALLRAVGTDVVLVDFDLPDLRGDKIAEVAQDEGLGCKVIIHSGRDAVDLPRGVAAWIIKDGDIDSLLTTVREVALDR